MMLIWHSSQAKKTDEEIIAVSCRVRRVALLLPNKSIFTSRPIRLDRTSSVAGVFCWNLGRVDRSENWIWLSATSGRDQSSKRGMLVAFHSILFITRRVTAYDRLSGHPTIQTNWDDCTCTRLNSGLTMLVYTYRWDAKNWLSSSR